MFSTYEPARWNRGTQRARRGLTLVEMLVAMALTLMIVFAIVQMFQWVGERTTASRSVLELAGQVRAAANLLQQDLDNCTAQTISWNRDPESGYFEATEQTPSKDADAAKTSSLAGDTDDVIMFTACSKGAPYVGTLNGVSYTSALAEIIWWVGQDANGDTNLYRRVLLIRPDLDVSAAGAAGLQDFYNKNDISVRQAGGTLVANSTRDLWLRQNRFAHIGDDGNTSGSNGVYPLSISKLMTRVRSGPMLGTDVVLSKVSAFDMRVYDPRAIVYSGAGGAMLTPTDPGYSSATAKTQLAAGQGSGSPTPPSSPSTTPVAIDSGGAGYAFTGTWSSWSVGGGVMYNNNEFYVGHVGGGYPAASATWTFTGLVPGQYKVFASWYQYSNQATDAPYAIYDNTSLLQTAPANQTVAPAGMSYGGTNWQQLATVTITSTTIKVTLTNNANSTVVADGVMIQGIASTPPPTPTLTSSVGEGAFVDLGYDPNTTRYQASSSSGTTTGPTFGPYVAIDSGGSGYSSTGTWSSWSFGTTEMYNNSELYVGHVGGGYPAASATWTFSGLTPGQYKVFASWYEYSNQATNAPYSIYDNTSLLQTVPANQTSNPPGPSYGGCPWGELATVTITSSTLKVTLTNNANSTVVADGVMIQNIIPGTTTGAVVGTYVIPLSYFSQVADPKSKLGAVGVWDTWPAWFEANGIDEDGDGVNDNAVGGDANSVTDSNAKETLPPYTMPLRGIMVVIRVYEPQSRQVLQRSVVGNFVR